MLSSTTRPTAIAKPASDMKFSDMSVNDIISTPISTLSGMDTAIIAVGRSASVTPRTSDGRTFSKNMNTTATANRKPSVPSRSRLSSDSRTSGPESLSTAMSNSGGSALFARPSAIAACMPSVTSTVLASGSFTISSVMLDAPFVRDMGQASLCNSTSAASDTRMGRAPNRACGMPPSSARSKPTTKSRSCRTDPSAPVVRTG